MQKPLDLYLIAARQDRYILFSPVDAVEQCETASSDRVRRSIAWLMHRKNRLVAWIGRTLNAAHGYYVRLEDRIDPVERVFKAVACSGELTVHHASTVDPGRIRSHFQGVLRRGRLKHAVWLSVDAVISGIVIAFTPILAPIPGPNIFLYYPVLRLLSHLRALRGAASALRSSKVQFKSLPDLSGLEENLQTRRFDRGRIGAAVRSLNISGLDRFLERMV
jgi:hypothetical protein